ncbi:twin-arginine translocase subunit TatC [Litorihabitans aurantiacus]|uniref:Sec-independent protein translocase protein TatC n=1 Tax=Litorihabitans aurantiacus TaxID=1930061 RepID=A0AA37XGB7_9MICO|nr:twin-arginine translocase subunit TatC [Litorihabitans aurantiacus]GMA32613.1 Sec-independent protein translocase protein TatC [Litorihabitans aurantiacus]
MALGDHLRELRKRFVWALVGIVVGAVAGWFLYEPVFTLVAEGIRDAEGGGVLTDLNFTQAMSAFDLKVRVSFFLGVLFASPWWIYQIWAFISPGLTRREKLRSTAFVAAAVPLFLGGATIAWLALPNALGLLTAATPDGVSNLIDAANYLTFVMQFMLIFGLAFLLPLLMVAVTATGLVRGSTWRKGWRWAIVGIFTFAAFATPSPDAISMIVMALPICGLYAIALLVCARFDVRRDRREAALDAELDARGGGGDAGPAVA